MKSFFYQLSSRRRMAAGLCVAAVAFAAFAPASNTDPYTCMSSSSQWCGNQVSTYACDPMQWSYLTVKSVTYTCTGAKASHIGGIVYTWLGTCCAPQAPEPADPTVTCSPCPKTL